MSNLGMLLKSTPKSAWFYLISNGRSFVATIQR